MIDLYTDFIDVCTPLWINVEHHPPIISVILSDTFNRTQRIVQIIWPGRTWVDSDAGDLTVPFFP